MLIQRLGIFCNFITGGKVTVEPASAGEAALAGGQTTFPRPSLAKRASSEMTVVFGIVPREYCEQIEPPVRMIEPASAINRATQCNRESH